MASKKFFVIDAMNLIYRCYHGFGAQKLSTSSGIPTSAILGCTKFLLKLIATERPDYLAIASDPSTVTFRHDLYDGYKATRSAMPDDLSPQIQYVYRLFEVLGCPVIKSDSLEADDIIGSLVTQFKGADVECYIVSGDKDFMQLVDDKVTLYRTKTGGQVDLLDPAGVYAKMSCNPDQIVDYLAIVGDTSDNVPGVKGIGEKGAVSLIKSYSNLQNIYNNLEKITSKRYHQALVDNKDMAFLSKELVTIKLDAVLPFTLDEMKCNPDEVLSSIELLEFLEELEFDSCTDSIKSNIARRTNSAAVKLRLD